MKYLAHKNKTIISTLLLFFVGLFAFSGSAKAESFQMDIDKAQVTLGAFYEKTPILPVPPSAAPNMWTQTPVGYVWGACLNPALATPCEANPSGAAIVGEEDGGNVTVPANGFRFPIMYVPNPLNPADPPVPFTLKADSELTGSVDGAGGVTLDGNWRLEILAGLGFPAEAGGPNPFYRCSIALPGMELITGASTPRSAGFMGTPFAAGLSGDGALTGTWGRPLPSSAEGPPGASEELLALTATTCSGRVDLVLAGIGGVWLSSGIDSPAPYPECSAGQVGQYPNCADAVARVSGISAQGPSKAKRGKVAVYKIRISAGGNTAAQGVRLKVAGRGVSINTSVGSIAPGSSKTVTLRVKFKKKGKVQAKFTASSTNAGGKSINKTVVVK